ncbi:hypothetical protein F0L68_40605 [Solihabitans fulvus]|uniref:Uncharacterized protein n=1 Tax=Solihabitans fulvus TaxID=1892852 RepID=A0A5B2W6J0_9PSEU|nr:hypothetical protein [Solihabitans fulvus]KAA2246468.1 hypothetical protein F0L68_40605 [Solihabitans fulvus]
MVKYVPRPSLPDLMPWRELAVHWIGSTSVAGGLLDSAPEEFPTDVEAAELLTAAGHHLAQVRRVLARIGRGHVDRLDASDADVLRHLVAALDGVREPLLHAGAQLAGRPVQVTATSVPEYGTD